MPCCGMFCGLKWEGNVAGGQGLFWDGLGSKTCVYRSCQGALWHAGAWKPRCGVAGCILWHAGAWNPRCSVARCILGYAIAWDSTL